MTATAGRQVGLVMPANNEVLVPELTTTLNGSLSFEVVRLPVEGSSTEDVRNMATAAAEDMSGLLIPGAQSYVYACVASTLASPPGWEIGFVERFEDFSGCPCITAMSATLRAVSALGARRLSLLTPYPKDLHRRAAAYLEHEGFFVVSSETLDIVDLDAVASCPPEQLESAARAAVSGAADALCILATDLPTFGSIALLEETIGIPVVTTNQAIAWSLTTPSPDGPVPTVLARLASADHRAGREGGTAVRHIALYKWNPDTSTEQIDTALSKVQSMAGQIPELIRLACGPNLAAEPGGYTHYVELEVADHAALTAYKQHPAHRAVAEFIRPLLNDHLSLDTENHR